VLLVVPAHHTVRFQEPIFKENFAKGIQSHLLARDILSPPLHSKFKLMARFSTLKHTAMMAESV